MRFGIKDNFIELQSSSWSEEQIKVLESLSQDKAPHLVELLFTGHVSKRSVARFSPAKSDEVIEHFRASLPILGVACVMIKIISGLNDLGAQVITFGDYVHRLVIKNFRLNAVQVPHFER